MELNRMIENQAAKIISLIKENEELLAENEELLAEIEELKDSIEQMEADIITASESYVEKLMQKLVSQ